MPVSASARISKGLPRSEREMASHNVDWQQVTMPDFLRFVLEVLIGIGLLFAGGEVFVQGSVTLSLIFGIPLVDC